MTTALAAAFVLALIAAPAAGQGSGKSRGKPPSTSTLPKPTAAGLAAAGIAAIPWGGGSTTGAPAAWMDEANLLAPGDGSFSAYASVWRGASTSEVDAPVVDASVGVARRLQIGANVPHVVGNDAGSVVGGLGTAFLSAKIGVITDSTAIVKVAVSPTLEVLGRGVLASMPADTNRLRFALPVIAEIDRGPGRVFASTGYFSPGGWFAGVGVGVQPTTRTGVTVSFSRAWTDGGEATTAVPSRARHEVAGGVSYSLRPQLAVFTSLARTIATADENGAGVTITGGLSIFARAKTR